MLVTGPGLYVLMLTEVGHRHEPSPAILAACSLLGGCHHNPVLQGQGLAQKLNSSTQNSLHPVGPV